MEFAPWRESKRQAAIQQLPQGFKAIDAEAAVAAWLLALSKVGVGTGLLPMRNDERITPFVCRGKCNRCRKTKRVTIVLDGFKGEIVGGNALLCDNCIATLL